MSLRPLATARHTHAPTVRGTQCSRHRSSHEPDLGRAYVRQEYAQWTSAERAVLSGT
ncbi:hypothetical protein OG462_41570 [Streptomyces sp. NBC_01077]|uniref:hypothetical protein n=1 Tax=Streptomyces sp. NBC_01077 TaxID=2903746 RepID=UPI00386DCF1C|nr:hypothetical protein OG462_41570 [Streptomyces sp. NBC_01077]